MLARFTLLVSCVVALGPATLAQQQAAAPAPATIIKYVNENNGADGYFFEFETSDGVIRTEKGVLTDRGTDQEAMVVTGRVSWIANDNKRYTLDFTADRNGYRPMYTIA